MNAILQRRGHLAVSLELLLEPDFRRELFERIIVLRAGLDEQRGLVTYEAASEDFAVHEPGARLPSYRYVITKMADGTRQYRAERVE